MEQNETRERELALQLAVGHQLPGDTTDSIVARAEKFAAFLGSKTK
ncbi:hypothetical protein VC74_gp91 [Mycobacterium phage Sparky]|uniref:Uncharacterized protein n=1 Tax=Mycobacterium phage Sparky TaxID=1527493 RepID=A0A076G861_9CAUD|nr:hypothetical protein VC74_gp91 [Mycobacterium phage Sparky]AII28179.1 hypothetical protein PBI_SPARKY_35 [Mycobacterium phage Sparky]